ncbi:MAG: nitroreductase family protein [Romboutsia sp.]|uniref:nitroreductase family protein n=1 Tax=Romboutsia sp. TaxID=1965302 RepID=UPI003F325101
MLEEIMIRRSIRSYINKNVEEDKITQILKAGMQAPSSKNSCPWEFVVVDNKYLLEKLSATHHRAKHINGAPMCIVIVGNSNKFKKAGKWIQDLGACTQNILLEVVNQGLAACWVGVFPKLKRVDYVRQVLDLPKELVPYAIIPIGYSLEENEFVDKYDESKVHRNKYNK